MSEGIKAFANYERDWDNLPQDVQNALNADWITLEEAKALVTEANNSLYGSHGYFHSLNGGAFDKYHLATGIEALKSSSRLAHSSQARLSEAVKVLEPLVQYLEDDGPILASDIEILSNAKAFLATLGEER